MAEDVISTEAKIAFNWKKLMFLLLGVALFMVVYYSPQWPDAIDPMGKHFELSKEGKGALAVFLLCALSETLQYFGIFALARVFDPYDYLMYGAGVMLAVFFDKVVFKRWLSFWDASR